MPKILKIFLAVFFTTFLTLECAGKKTPRGAFSLFCLHQARPADLRKGKRLVKNDRLFTWPKPKQRPAWLPQSWWKKIPAELSVRVIRFKLDRRAIGRNRSRW
jgi:hypothetical protein